jgi:hypothetical protein
MERQREVNIILGCGERGMYWSPRAMASEMVVPMDSQQFNLPTANFVISDTLNLPIASNSVNRLFADFVLNAIEMRGASMREVIASPELLGEENRPREVKDWFDNVLEQSPEKFRRNPEALRWILREIALKEMWRVIKEGGSITLVDHAHVVNWLRVKKNEIFPPEVHEAELKMPPLFNEDFNRSLSLERLSTEGARIGKAVIRKTAIQYPIPFDEYIEQLTFGRISSY